MIVRALISLLLWSFLYGKALADHPFPGYCKVLASKGLAPLDISDELVANLPKKFVRIKKLLSESSMTVFLVEDNQGREWVVRMGTRISNIRREAFSKNMLEAIGSIKTTEPFLVENAVDAIQKMISLIEQNPTIDAQKVKVQLEKMAESDRLTLSIAPYYEGMKRGDDLIASQFPFYGLFKERKASRALAFQRLKLNDKKSMRDFMATRHKELENVNPHVLYRMISRSEVYEKSGDDFLAWKLEEAFDDRMKEQMADFWVIFQVLGLLDSKGDNVIVDSRGVFYAADMAHPFSKNSSDNINDGVNPLKSNIYKYSLISGAYQTNLVEQRFYLQNFSDKTAIFFANLDQKKIEEMAKKARYSLEEGEAEGILIRARYVLEQRKRLRGKRP